MKTRAFSLLEMIIVIAVIVLISAISVPAVSSLIHGPRLTQAGQLLTAQLSLARQHATTKNRPVEVRFLRFQDPEMPRDSAAARAGQFRAMQLLEVTDSSVPLPLGNVELLPQAIVFCGDSRSSVLDPGGTPPQIARAPSPATDAPLPRGIGMSYQYVAFRFLPNGSTTLAANRNWFITVLAAKDAGSTTQLPANFFTLQIDPVSGITRDFRPGL